MGKKEELKRQRAEATFVFDEVSMTGVELVDDRVEIDVFDASKSKGVTLQLPQAHFDSLIRMYKGELRRTGRKATKIVKKAAKKRRK